MRTRIPSCIASSVLAMATFTTIAQAYDVLEIPTERGDVTLYVPSEADPNALLPLVVSLHGFTGNSTQHEQYFNLRSQVDQQQFMLCLPDGITNPQGDRFWNATDACCDFTLQRPDDSGYLRSLIETIILQQPVDLDSIHVVGHSNGGFMSYRMACDNADLIASIASLAGATFNNTSLCTPSEPVHVLQIHGTNDTTIEYDGNCFAFLCYPGAMESIMIWAQYNQCSGTSETAESLDLVGNISGAETSRTIVRDACLPQGTTELWTINGGNHGPAFNGNFSRELIAWLLAHRRGTDSACPGDLNDDFIVDGMDLGVLLAAWSADSPCKGQACNADIDGDDRVNGADLGAFLAAWGNTCP